MAPFRAFLLQYRALAALLVAAALLLKLAVPAGYMLGGGAARTVTIAVCQDASGGAVSVQLAIPMKKGAHEAPGKPAKGECPYGTLSMDSLAAADPVLLALALAFILALGFAPLRFALPTPSRFVLPPQCGPPARA